MTVKKPAAEEVFVPLDGFFVNPVNQTKINERRRIDLTVLVDMAGDNEARLTAGYRELMGVLHRDNDLFELKEIENLNDSRHLLEVLNTLSSEYVLFTHPNHSYSEMFMWHLGQALTDSSRALIEPVFFATRIPATFQEITPLSTETFELSDNYHAERETDVYGVTFHRQKLISLLKASGNIDRSTIYLNYRIFWQIDEVELIEAGYVYNTTRRLIKGIEPAADTDLLYLNHVSAPYSLRPALAKHLVLVLRFIRTLETVDLRLETIRTSIEVHELATATYLLAQRDAFESVLVRSLGTKNGMPQLFKEMQTKDILLSMNSEPVDENSIELYALTFADSAVSIKKHYHTHDKVTEVAATQDFSFYDYPVTENSLILMFDRPLAADDNAEHFYRYVMKNHPEFTNIRFGLRTISPDWERLEEEGFNLVPMFSKEFYKDFIESDLVISSQMYLLEKGGKNFSNSRFLYLQHGIQLNDMKEWSANKAYDVFVTTGTPETEYMKTIALEETFNVGLPRLATLERKSDTKTGDITFMPTWRFALDHLTPVRFEQSEFVDRINRFLSDPDLLNYLEKSGRQMRVKLHPNLEKFASRFMFSNFVRHSTASYRDLIENSDVIVTDYSSVVCDAAFIGIPVVYYQWDADHFFSMQAYSSRLDFQKEGLGPVFEEHDNLVEYLVNEDFNFGQPEYQERVKEFFEGVDKDLILPRIFERMLQL